MANRHRHCPGGADRIFPGLKEETAGQFGPRNEDRYGRALFYVYTEAEKLIREGLGKAWERDGQHRDLLMVVEDGAERNTKRGLC